MPIKFFLLFLTLHISFVAFSQDSLSVVLNYYEGQDEASGIAVDSAGFIFIVGTQFGPSVAHVAKLNPQGDTIWTSTLSQDSLPYSQSAAYGDGGLVLLSGSKVAIVGTLYDSTGGNWHGYFAHFDSETGVQTGLQLFGGIDEYYFSSIIKLSDGNLLIGGSVERDTSGQNDMVAIKINPSGNVIWEYDLGFEHDEITWSQWETNDGHLLLAGRMRWNGISSNVLYKLSSSGAEVWSRYFRYGQYSSSLTGVLECENGDYLVTGAGPLEYDGPTITYLARWSKHADFIWDARLDGSDAGNHFNRFSYFDGRPIELEDGCFFVVGSASRLVGPIPTVAGMYMIVSGEGDYLNHRVITHEGFSDQFYSSVQDQNGNFLFAGYANDEDEGRGSWFYRIDTSDIRSCYNLLHPDGIEEMISQDELMAFPNPTKSKFTVQLGEAVRGKHLRLFNSIGQEITTEVILQSSMVSVDLSNRIPGIYYYVLEGNGKLYSGKILKQ